MSPSTKQKEPEEYRFYENVAAGLAAGVTGTVIGYPLDLVKTRLQLSSKEHKSGVNSFTMARSILRREGPMSFFKGLMTPLVSISIISTITFSCYSWLQNQMHAKRGWDWKNAVAGLASAPLTVPMTTVEGLVRTQMQVDNIHKKEFQGSWQCITTIVRVHGLATLLTGTAVTGMRDGAYLCAYFYVYEGLKATMITGTANNHDDNATYRNPYFFSVRPEIAVPVAGGTSGAVAWFVSIPIECVRVGVQGQTLDEISDKHRRKSGMQIFRDIIGSRGIRALYRGVAPTMVRAFIVSASRFSAYETTLWLFQRQHHHHHHDPSTTK